MKLHTKLGIGTLFALILFPNVVHAHSGMYTAKYVDGGNIILMTHNAHSPQSGESILYNFRVFDTAGIPLEFDTAQIEHKRGDKIIETKSLPVSDVGDINFYYTYPKQGQYTMLISFNDNSKKISSGDFPITVTRGPKQGVLVDIATWQSAVIFVLGAGSMYAYLNKSMLKRVVLSAIPRQQVAKKKSKKRT